jgi:hypothetical protein
MPRDMAESGDRPADKIEIEITPEMIEAGVRELIFDDELIKSEVAEGILRAALTAGGYKVP